MVSCFAILFPVLYVTIHLRRAWILIYQWFKCPTVLSSFQWFDFVLSIKTRNCMWCCGHVSCVVIRWGAVFIDLLGFEVVKIFKPPEENQTQTRVGGGEGIYFFLKICHQFRAHFTFLTNSYQILKTGHSFLLSSVTCYQRDKFKANSLHCFKFRRRQCHAWLKRARKKMSKWITNSRIQPGVHIQLSAGGRTAEKRKWKENIWPNCEIAT